MKKTISTIIAIIAFNMMVQAQEGPEIWMTYDLMPKKGMTEQFEAAAAKKNKKRSKKRRAGEMSKDKGSDPSKNGASNGSAAELAKRRVHFDLSQNKVTEFFKHGKVA